MLKQGIKVNLVHPQREVSFSFKSTSQKSVVPALHCPLADMVRWILS